MQRILCSAILACAPIWSAHLKAEDADSEPLLENDRIQIEYVKPGEPASHADLRDNEGDAKSSNV